MKSLPVIFAFLSVLCLMGLGVRWHVTRRYPLPSIAPPSFEPKPNAKLDKIDLGILKASGLFFVLFLLTGIWIYW